MGQTQRFNDILTLVNRPQEVVASLQQLQQAYVNYYRTVADFNRAQFRLFYALGYPAEVLACRRPPGPIEPVETYRGPALPNVAANRPLFRKRAPRSNLVAGRVMKYYCQFLIPDSSVGRASGC